jgi:hypothetical protein
MGGFGSGRREYATTPTVEECRHLSADKFTDAVEHPGHGGVIYWGDPDDPAASIRIVLLSDTHLADLKDGKKLETKPVEDAPDTFQKIDTDTDAGERATAAYLEYTITNTRTDESREVSYLVPVDYTDCNFGGVRPWFRCPTDAGGCNRRVGKLYLPPGRDQYLCRECYDLGYRSSRNSGNELERAEQRYRKAFAKADAEDRRPHPNNSPFLPDKPKGMHRDTFDDLLADVRDAREEWDREMNERMRELLAEYDTGGEYTARAMGYTD